MFLYTADHSVKCIILRVGPTVNNTIIHPDNLFTILVDP